MTAESRAATAISPIREPGSLALSGTEGRPAAMLASIATGCQIELASRIPSVGNGGGDPAGQVFNRREELGVSQSIDAITDCELTRPAACVASPHALLLFGSNICIAWRCGNDRGAELERAASEAPAGRGLGWLLNLPACRAVSHPSSATSDRQERCVRRSRSGRRPPCPA